MMPNIEKTSKRRTQRDVLQKYRPYISATNDQIALDADTSLESVRRTINGVQSHPGVLQVLKDLLIASPEWEGGTLPADLAHFLSDQHE